MARIRRVALLALSLITIALGTPGGVSAAGGPAPGETCVPGTVWEDKTSGVKYLCIYDEGYGGTRWELISSGQRGNAAWLYRSSTYGCLYGTAAITSIGGSGADAIMRTYRWPCQGAADRITQPVGEIRSRIVIQSYGGTWSTCRDSGYLYSSSAASGWLAGLDMGTAADCGSGTYRAWGYGSFLQGGAWRGGTLPTPSLFLR